ncbi:MAG: DUF4258 domain-containing protein [Anaerolineales bacterium]|nr:DUF4258 domain-containing protein [Anaerolineales bacterium]
MQIRFSEHALQRMKERKVQAEEVYLVLAGPDGLRYGEDGEIIVSKVLGQRTVEIVYIEIDDIQRVITVMVM